LIRLEPPQRLAVLCVERDEGASAVAEEDQSTSRRHQAAADDAAGDVRQLPRDLAGLNVHRAKGFTACTRFPIATCRAAVERLACLPPFVVLRIEGAGFLAEQIKKSSQRTERGRGPVGGASVCGAHAAAFSGWIDIWHRFGPAVGADTA